MSENKLHPDSLAFPFIDNDGAEYPGLTARQYFAAEAMKGLLANHDNSFASEKHLARLAVVQAEALIDALNE